MFGFIKKLFGIQEPTASAQAEVVATPAPYKVEAPAQESAPVAAEPRKEVTTEASKPAAITASGSKKQSSPKKQGAPKKQGGNKPRKPKAPKAPAA